MASESYASRLKRQMANPAACFRNPVDVVNRRGLPYEAKLKVLAHWEHDARSLAVADDEGMSGGEESMHDLVLDALQMLKERDQDVGHAMPLPFQAASRTARRISNSTRSHPLTNLLVAVLVGYVARSLRSTR